MGRLIDVDILKQNIAEVIKKQKGKANDLIPVRELPLFIDNQTTAYDVERVVEELEYFLINYGVSSNSNLHRRIIEIVKQGGVGKVVE